MKEIIEWIKTKLDLKDKIIIKEKDNKCLINVYSEDIQQKILQEYKIKVPLYSVYDTESGLINSPLYFEMWEPSKEYKNGY